MRHEKSLLEKLREIAYKYALLNAYKHSGKAELKPVISKVIAELPEVRKNIREVLNVVKNVISEVNKLSIAEQERILKENWPELLEIRKEEEKKLPPLPRAELGKVVTRFAPNPDYTIHLGNARPALLSYWYAEMYKGRLVLRFEDTDPRTKAPFPEAYEKIKEDLRWLGIKWDEEYIQSLRLPIFYEVAKELIAKGGAYVDRCSAELFRKYRDSGRACPHRNLAVDKQLEEFDKVLEGYYGEGEAAIRIKTDITHPDPSIRDWVALRIIDTSKTPHPLVGDRYILWPTYNFAAAVDDHLMRITHILRAKEHITNTIKQKYLYDHMGWKYPETIHFGRLSLEGIILSKSKMRKMIKEYGIEPYSDPRFGTLSGLKRRGITREAIWEIVRSVGIKSIDAEISFANLAAINRSIIDPIAKRYMAIEKPIPLVFELEKPVTAYVIRHPSTGEKQSYTFDKGKHIVYISAKDYSIIKNKVFRLMGMANFTIQERIELNGNTGYKAEVISFSPEEAKKRKYPIIQWVKLEEAIGLDLLIPKGMEIIYRKLLVERYISERKPGDHVQLYRIGFAKIDHKSSEKITCIFTHS
ncbi:MAG: glutamate--tRNA ligase [Thermoprotei archaeon]|nr:MAG: glutamate--tRNA ligase [Thermoprotei archaeon]